MRKVLKKKVLRALKGFVMIAEQRSRGNGCEIMCCAALIIRAEELGDGRHYTKTFAEWFMDFTSQGRDEVEWLARALST